jgi:hypothetical protein
MGNYLTEQYNSYYGRREVTESVTLNGLYPPYSVLGIGVASQAVETMEERSQQYAANAYGASTETHTRAMRKISSAVQYPYPGSLLGRLRPKT